MAATLKDIATEVGLSHVTVSKVLRGTGNFTPETRQRVLAAADRMKYRPHALARSMREGRTGIVGLIYSAEGTSRALTSQQLVGIQEELGRRSYELMMGMLPRAALKEPGQASALLRHWMADGLLINHQIGLPSRVAELVQGDHVPAIWMNSKQPHNCVYFDDFNGSVTAVDHLVSLGHRRIAYVDLSHPRNWLHDNEHYSIGDRHDGYVVAMNRHQLRPVVWMPDHTLDKHDRVAFARQQFLGTTDERPTAIISYGHQQELLFMAAHEGLDVPKDLSLISFAGDRAGIDDRIPTLVFQPWEELGRLAVHQLLVRIGGVAGSVAQMEERATSPVALTCPIRAGDTVAPPPAA